jgi:hypothetical protein
MLGMATRGTRRKLGDAVRLIDSTGLHLAGVGTRWARFGCPARFVLEKAHGIDSSRFQKVANRLDTKRGQRRAASE